MLIENHFFIYKWQLNNISLDLICCRERRRLHEDAFYNSNGDLHNSRGDLQISGGDFYSFGSDPYSSGGDPNSSGGDLYSSSGDPDSSYSDLSLSPSSSTIFVTPLPEIISNHIRKALNFISFMIGFQ